MVNLIFRDVLVKNPSILTKITSASRVTVLLRSSICCGISTYSVTTGSDDLLVVFLFRDATLGPNIVLAMVTSSGVTGQLLVRP